MTMEKREEEVEEEEWGEKKRGETESRGAAGAEREEETDDTGSLSQTLSDSSVCTPFPEGSAAIPDVKTWCGGGGGRRVVEVGGEGGTPAFRRLVEEGKPHGKRPVQGLSLWQVTTLRERNKQTKQKNYEKRLEIAFKVQWTLFPR